MPKGRPKGSLNKATREKLLAGLTPIQRTRNNRRELCEASFIDFVCLVQPLRTLGNIHREVLTWMSSEASGSHLLLLLPRDHGKSWAAGMYATWELTRNPATRILYISSTSNLAVKQLKFVKDILISDVYRMHWPEMVLADEGKREKWTEREISIDHPLRKKEFIRDPSIFTAGLTTNIVGMHCDLAVLDDVVVDKNAYIEDMRDKVKDQYSALSSIEGVNAKEIVVGTRYHPKDLYSDLQQLETHDYDELGNHTKATPLFNVKEFPVENIGDGSGEFLWPRQQRTDGKWFGFDAKILAEKREKYINKVHFRAQYYNDPHDSDSAPIDRTSFQYYDREHLFFKGGKWWFKGNPLNVVAAMDFAYSTGEKSDYTSIVVVGADGLKNYYVLDIVRFKTKRVSDYYAALLKLYEKWGFRKVRAEVTAAQTVIVNDLKENYIRPMGLSLSIDEFKPSRWQGSKEERIMATLEPKYANKQMYHYLGGNCQILEEELVYMNPAHDDVKDALASAVDLVTAPVNTFRLQQQSTPRVEFNQKFGGVA